MENEHINHLSCEHEVYTGVELHKFRCQSGRKMVGQFDRLVVKSFWISDLQGNQVAGYSALSNKLRYQSQALTHLCQKQLVHGERRKKNRFLFKIHESTWKWLRSSVCSDMSSSTAGWLPALYEERKPSSLSAFLIFIHIFVCSTAEKKILPQELRVLDFQRMIKFELVIAPSLLLLFLYFPPSVYEADPLCWSLKHYLLFVDYLI